MKSTRLSVLVMTLVCAVALPASAQSTSDVPLGVFGVELLVGSFSAAGGMVVGKWIPLGAGPMLGAVLASTISVGAVGWLMGANGNWFLAGAGALGAWFLSDYFGAGFFTPRVVYRFGALPIQVSSQDAFFFVRAIGTAFGATVGFSTFR